MDDWAEYGHTAKEIKTMFRTARRFGTGAMFVIVMSSLMTVSGCTGPGTPPPTPFTPVALTPVPVSGPTLAQSSNVALAIINAMPAQIGQFTLSHDPLLTYVGKSKNTDGTYTVVGDRITYTTNSGAQLVFAIWIGQDANYPVDRYNIELQRLTPGVAAIPVEVGDLAFVSPTNKGRDDNFAYNPNVWGVAVFRNIGIDLDPSKTLTDQISITKDEAVQLLQVAVNAIPK
jgi:hypothetical protein